MTEFQLPATTHIGSVHLTVADMSRALDFYVNRLGFQLLGQDGSQVTLSADKSTPLIILTEVAGAQPKPQRSTGLYHVAIRFPDRGSLARAFQRLINTRWQFGGFSDHAVSEALYLSDADGNGLEMYRDRPREEWRQVNGQIQMGTEPLDLEDLLSEVAKDSSPWTGVASGTDIGHVHLHVSDLGRAREFYHGLLGLDIVFDMSSHGALFVSAGGYHHHIGLNTWAGNAPPPANAVGMRSYQLVIPEADALETVAERVTKAGVQVDELASGGAMIHDFDGNAIELVQEQVVVTEG